MMMQQQWEFREASEEEALSGDTCFYLSAKSIRSIRSLLLSVELKL